MMQFMLGHQAKLDALVERNAEEIAELKVIAAKHDEQITAVTDLVGRLAQAEIRLVDRMEGLTDRVQGQEERLQSLETASTRFFESIERYFRGLGGNGQKQR